MPDDAFIFGFSDFAVKAGRDEIVAIGVGVSGLAGGADFNCGRGRR